jgi:hypothetical protein
MTDVDGLAKVAALLAGPVGAFAVMAIVALGFVTRRIVPGWIYDQCMDDGKTLRGDIAARIAKSEADLEQLRRDRMGQK